MGKEGKEYIRQRELRIAQNKARMDALRLPTIASGLLMGSSGGKVKVISPEDNETTDEDPDFHPASNDDDDDESSSDNSGYSNESNTVDDLVMNNNEKV